MRTHLLFIISFFSLLIVSCSKDDYEAPYDIYTITDYIPVLESMNMPRPEGSYTYPIIPGTDRWKEFQSRDEMEDACQVPSKILKKQSTQAVIQALWEFPLVYDFFAWDTYQKGYDFVHSPLNAYQELLKREDAAICLLDRYMLVSEINEGHFMAHYILEMHLAQEHFIKQLSSSDRKKVVKRTLEIIRIRRQNPDYYDFVIEIQVSYYLMGRIMKYDNYPAFSELLSIHPEWTDFFEYNNSSVITDEKIKLFSEAIRLTTEDYTNS